MLGIMYPFMSILIEAATAGNSLLVGMMGFFMTGMVGYTGATISRMKHQRALAKIHQAFGHNRSTVFETVARTGGGVMKDGKAAPKVMANGRLSQGGGTISNARKKANRKNRQLMKKQGAETKSSNNDLQEKGNAGVKQQVKFDPSTGQVYLLEKSSGGAKGLITG